MWYDIRPTAFFTNLPWMIPVKPSIVKIDNTFFHGYIDYFNGRCIKTNFRDLTKINTDSYNWDADPNAFETSVKELNN